MSSMIMGGRGKPRHRKPNASQETRMQGSCMTRTLRHYAEGRRGYRKRRRDNLQGIENMNDKHPIQPLNKDSHGVMRFKENEIVRYLLEAGPFDLNQLALMNFSAEDHEQLAQLIGYSLSGFGDLSYVSDETYNAAELMAKGQDERDARIEALTKTLNDVRKGMADVVPHLFNIHSDDLLDEYL